MKNDILVYTPTGPASYELTAIVHEYSSLIWHEKCKEPGEVQLNAPKTETNLRALVEENVLMLENHTVGKAHQSGLVRGAIITEVTDSEDEEDLVVTGRMLDWLLTWRTVPDSPKTGSGTYGAALYDLLAAGATFDAVRWLKSRDDYAAMGSDAGNPTYEQGELYEVAQSLIGVEKNLYFEVGFTPEPEPAPEPEPEWKTTGKVHSTTVETIADSKVGKTVIYGASETGDGRLPSGYTELEYIESTGTQYIDTGFVPNDKTRATLDFEIGEISSTVGMFGSRQSSSGSYADSYCVWGISGNKIRSDFGETRNQSFDVSVNVRHSVDKNGNATFLDGVEKVVASESSFESPETMVLFAVKSGTSVSNFSSFKFVSMKVYDDGLLVRDYVPCKDKGGQVGLYDLANSEFYGNRGSGSFVAGPEVPKLPAGYTRLEYIESTGTQYIDTGIKVSSETKMMLDFKFNVSTYNTYIGMMGTRISSSSKSFCVWRWNTQQLRSDYGDSVKTFIGNADTERHVIVKDATTTTVDGETKAQETRVNFDTGLNAYLFAVNESNSPSYPGPMRVYRFEIYNDGILSGSFVPCKNQSGDVGMYDTVSSKFYGNEGTGSFVAGQEIEIPSVPMSEVGLAFNGEKWTLDLGGKTLGEGQILTVERDGSANIDGVSIPLQTMPTMPSIDVEISTASSLPHYFELEYLQQGEKGEPTERSPLVLNIFQGRDLSSKVEFSTELANLKGFEITSGITDYRNVAKVVGEFTVWYPSGERPTGLDRREIYVDGSSVKSEDYYPTAGSGGVIDEETGEMVVEPYQPIPPEYQTASQKEEVLAKVTAAMYQLGAEAVADHPKTESVNFEILDFGQYEYMEDWDLGDVVRVSDENKGLSFNMAITEVQEVFDSEGYRVVPTFGTPAVSLQKVIRRLKR